MFNANGNAIAIKKHTSIKLKSLVEASKE